MRKVNLFFVCIGFVLGNILICTGNPLRDCVKHTYYSQIGVRELTGKNDGKSVEMYLQSVKLGKGYPWCAAFVNWTLLQCGLKPKMSAWSPAWFDKNRVVYKRGHSDNKVPDRGDVFGLYFPNLKRIGHVGFIDSWSDKEVITVEGNTNGAGSREGNGVYRKRRMVSQIYIVSDWITK
jgi:CHAP domain